MADDALYDLRDALVDAYNDLPSAQQITARAGIVSGTGPPTYLPMRDWWWKAIEALKLQGKLVALVDVAIADPTIAALKPKFEALKPKVEALCNPDLQNTTPSSSSPPAPKVEPADRSASAPQPLTPAETVQEGPLAASKMWRWLLPLAGLLALGVVLWFLLRPKSEPVATILTATPAKEPVWVTAERPGSFFGDTVQITLSSFPVNGCRWEPPTIGFRIAVEGATDREVEDFTRGQSIEHAGYWILVKQIEPVSSGFACRVEFLVTKLTPTRMPTTTPAHTSTATAPLPPSDTANSLIITEPVRMEFVRVPAGEFLMGSDKAKDPDASADEFPQHTVDVAEFCIGKYEVTNAQYATFVQATGYPPPEYWADGVLPAGKKDHPVVNVAWHDAAAFTDWLSAATGKRFRLPTEAEWEKTCRGADGRIYPWGAVPDTHKANYADSVGDTTPVGKYSSQGDNLYGAADMIGNIQEWTSSWDAPYPYNATDGREDRYVVGDARALRGGSYYDDAKRVRCAFRYFHLSGAKWGLGGFRVVFAP